MNRLKKGKSLFAFLLVLAMASALAACSGSNDGNNASGDASPAETESAAASGEAPASESAPAEEKQEPVTLTMWVADLPNGGDQKTPFSDYIKEKLGITLDVVTGNKEKFNMLIAGGDLPDLFRLEEAAQLKTLIESNSILALDDLIEQHGANLKANWPEKLTYSKQYLSDGTNKTYVIPIDGGKLNGADPVMGNGGLVGFYVRWDIYKEIGAPAVNNEEDLLNVLKAMQDKHPKTEDGKKVYALSSWNDWGTWPYWVPYGFSYGVQNSNYGAMINVIDGATEMQFGDTFWKGMKFWNKAYRMGLFDPEGFTMKNSNYLEKAKAGQVLTQYAQWWVNEINLTLNPGLKDPNGKGFQLLPSLPVIPEIYSIPNPAGSGATWATAISAKSKHADRAMQFIDFMNSDEGARLYYSGIKGEHWDVVDGKPGLTQKMIDIKNTDPNWGQTLGMIGMGHYNGVTGAHILADGYPADLSLTKDMVLSNVKDKEFDKDYTKHYGVDSGYVNEMWAKLVGEGKYKTKTRTYNFPNLVSGVSDDSNKATAKAEEYMKTFLPKIVMAKSDEGFDSAVAEAKEQLNKIGYDKASEEILKLLADAKAKAEAEGLD